VESTTPSWDEIAANQDFDKPVNWEQQNGLSVQGNAEPVYDTGPIAWDAAQPVEIEVTIPSTIDITWSFGSGRSGKIHYS
jgi:hypothetical protein